MDRFLGWPPGWGTLFLLPALFAAFTVHELSHALVAYLLGDTSQVERKRLSFNPMRHVSWLGMVAFLLIGIGWAKPVWVDWSRFRIKNRAFGMFLVSIAGASGNLLLALVAFLGIAATATVVSVVNSVQPVDVVFFMMSQQPTADEMGVAIALSVYMMNVNLLLAVFNLLPFPPLDGFQAVMSLINMARGLFRGQSRPALATVTVSGTAAVQDEPEAQSPAQIHFDIGLAYHKSGELDEAIARYRQALAHDDRFGLAYYNLGLAYLAKERPPLASSAFRAVLQARGDASLQARASQQLRNLARAERDPAAALGPVPEPLESTGEAEEPVQQPVPLDPALARRLWLRLALGAAIVILLGGAAWVYVTVVMVAAMD
jgi:Zn-dependent protease